MSALTYAEKCGLLEKYNITSLANELACLGYHGDHVTICGFFTTEEQFAKHADSLRFRLANMKEGSR